MELRINTWYVPILEMKDELTAFTLLTALKTVATEDTPMLLYI